jgi:hypothetical protein
MIRWFCWSAEIYKSGADSNVLIPTPRYAVGYIYSRNQPIMRVGSTAQPILGDTACLSE